MRDDCAEGGTSLWSTADPQYIDPWGGNFRYLDSSPVIDAGHAFLSGRMHEFRPAHTMRNVDADGNPRFQDHANADSGCGLGAHPDIGPWEYAGDVHEPPVQGDITGDGAIDIDELLVIIGDFGQAGYNCLADLNYDGHIGIDDMLLVLEHWYQP